MNYRFGRDRTFNCNKEFVAINGVMLVDYPDELEGHQHVVLENPQEIIHHEFDIVVKLKEVEIWGEFTVWYEIENHVHYIDAASKPLEAIKPVNAITFATLAENEMFDDVTVTEHSDMFLVWEPGVAYAVNNIRQYEQQLYKCLEAHTSQDDWTPDKTPALWKKVGDPAEEFPEWSQPIGAGDAYMTGDKVTYNNKHWQSTIDNNVWAPGVYGWVEV